MLEIFRTPPASMFLNPRIIDWNIACEIVAHEPDFKVVAREAKIRNTFIVEKILFTEGFVAEKVHLDRIIQYWHRKVKK